MLDYHLKAPPELIAKTESLYEQTLDPFIPIAEAISKPKHERDSFYPRAIKLALDAQEQGTKISKEIIKWVKQEKLPVLA